MDEQQDPIMTQAILQQALGRAMVGDFHIVLELAERHEIVLTQGLVLLRWAALHGDLNFIKYLISKGVDPRGDSVASAWAVAEGHTEVVNFLKLYEKDDLLHKVIREGIINED